MGAVHDFSTLVIDQPSLTDTLFSGSTLENNTTYYWHLSASNVAGESEFSEIWSFTTSTSTAVDWEISAITKGYALWPAYPNPFNPLTKFTYNLPENAEVSLVIYNSMGQFIQELVSGHCQAGEYEVTWDGRDERGAPVAGGLYICHLKTGSVVLTQIILLIR